MATLIQPITIGNVPQQITGTALFQKATFFGYTSFNISGFAVNNTATIRLGLNSGEMIYNLTSGSSLEFSLPGKQKESLSNFWINGSTGAVYINYY